MSKVFESLHLDRLKIYINTRPEQFGFRSKHSITAQLVKVIDDIAKNYNKRDKTTVSLLYIEKSFDKVWYDELIYKLI